MNNKQDLNIKLVNMKLKRDMITNLENDYKKFNQNNSLVNIENNNYLAKKIEIESSLLKDVSNFNSDLSFYKFMSGHKFWFIGFNKNYNEY